MVISDVRSLRGLHRPRKGPHRSRAASRSFNKVAE